MNKLKSLLLASLFFSFSVYLSSTTLFAQDLDSQNLNGNSFRTSIEQSLQSVENVFAALQDNFTFTPEFTEEIVNGALSLPNYQYSSQGSPLFYLKLGNWQDPELPTVIWVGGIHPDEFAPTLATWRLLEDIFAQQLNLNHARIIYIPYLNLDGLIFGHQRTGYPTRNNGLGKDLNRSFYNTDRLARGRGPAEIEFVLELAYLYAPTHWIIPHAALGLIDLDSGSMDEFLPWAQAVADLTIQNHAPILPYHDFPTYGDPRQLTGWSIGRYITSTQLDEKFLGGITFEFPGPVLAPAPGQPDPVSYRKHLGRYVRNTYLAHEYYEAYKDALLYSLQPEI